MTETNEAVGAEALEPVQVGGEVETPQPKENPDPNLADDAGQTEETQTDAQPGEPEPPKKKGGFQRTIEKKDADIRNLTQEKYKEKLRADALERELTAERNKSKPDSKQSPEKPKYTDFKTIEEWEGAVTEWAKNEGKNEGYKQATEDGKQRQTQESIRSQAAALQAREDAAAVKYPDYHSIVDPIAEIVMSNPTLRQYMVESDHSQEVGYYLGNNPEALDSLLRMSPTAALRELFSLEAKALAAPPPKATTKAPAPVVPLGGREPARKSLADLADKDMDGYVARRTKQKLAKLAAG